MNLFKGTDQSNVFSMPIPICLYLDSDERFSNCKTNVPMGTKDRAFDELILGRCQVSEALMGCSAWPSGGWQNALLPLCGCWEELRKGIQTFWQWLVASVLRFCFLALVFPSPNNEEEMVYQLMRYLSLVKLSGQKIVPNYYVFGRHRVREIGHSLDCWVLERFFLVRYVLA